jgi:hypothetical protein
MSHYICDWCGGAWTMPQCPLDGGDNREVVHRDPRRPFNHTEARIYDEATRNVQARGPEEFAGVPRHSYVPNSSEAHEDGWSCWFVWRESDGPGVSRCRSSAADHRKLFWFPADHRRVVYSDGSVEHGS